MQWQLTPPLRLRLAAFRTIKPPLVANRTLQPTQVAGFNQFFDDVNGTEAWLYGAGLDARLTDNLTAGTEVSKRNLSEPILVRIPGQMIREDRNEFLYRAYLYWTPHPEWAVSGEVQFDEYDSDTGLATEQLDLPAKVKTWSAPLSVRYFSQLGFFGVLTGTVVNQDVRRRQQRLPLSPDGNATSFIVDTAMGYRFPQGFGIASLEVRNLFDSRLKYQDDSFREFREGPLRLRQQVQHLCPDREGLLRWEDDTGT